MGKRKYPTPPYFLMTARVYTFDEAISEPVKNLYFYEPSIECFAYSSMDEADEAASRLLSPESVFDFNPPKHSIPPEVYCKWFHGPNLNTGNSHGLLNRYRVGSGSLGLMLLREVVSGRENAPVAARVIERCTCDDRWTQGLWKSTKDRIAASSTISARTIVGELMPSDMSWVQPGFPFFEMLETSTLE